MTKEDNSDREQAKAQYNSIKEMLDNLHKAEKEDDDEEAIEEAQQVIQEDPLSAEVVKRYEILLCTGGPAVRIVGSLDEHGQPETATLEYQDWFKPWTPYEGTAEQEETLLEYANHFYFGE